MTNHAAEVSASLQENSYRVVGMRVTGTSDSMSGSTYST